MPARSRARREEPAMRPGLEIARPHGMRPSSVVVLFLLSIALAVQPPQAMAGHLDNPPPLPGWTHSPAFLPADSPGRQGILLSGAHVGRSSPTIAEIDGDALNGREVVVGGDDGMLYVYGADGQLRWSENVLPASCNASS